MLFLQFDLNLSLHLKTYDTAFLCEKVGGDGCEPAEERGEKNADVPAAMSSLRGARCNQSIMEADPNSQLGEIKKNTKKSRQGILVKAHIK